MTDQTPLRGTDAARQAIRQARGDEAAPQIPILFAHHDETGTGNDPAAIGTVPLEIVNAIIRDPDSPCYPSQIGVYCDDCGTTVKADYAEALAESDPARLRAELVQVAAVAVCWIEAIDRRATADSEPDRP